MDSVIYTIALGLDTHEPVLGFLKLAYFESSNTYGEKDLVKAKMNKDVYPTLEHG